MADTINDSLSGLLSRNEDMRSLLQELQENVRRQEEEQEWTSNSFEELERFLMKRPLREGVSRSHMEIEFRRQNLGVCHCLEKLIPLAMVGFYLRRDDGDDFELVSSLGYGNTKSDETTIKGGEGLVGRCAQERRILCMNEIPAGYRFVSLSLESDGSWGLVLVPLIDLHGRVGRVLGVIEMVVCRRLQSHEIRFLDKAAASIASNIWEWRAQLRVNELSSEVEWQRDKLSELESDRDALDSLPFAVVTIDQECKIRAFNAAAEKLWGYRFDHVQGEEVSMLFDLEDLDEDEFLKAFVTPGMDKITDGRRETYIILARLTIGQFASPYRSLPPKSARVRYGSRRSSSLRCKDV